MSAPDAPLKRQKRRHRGPLIGTGIAVAFGLGMMLLWLFGSVSRSPPQDVPGQTGGSQIEGSEVERQTGQPVEEVPAPSGQPSAD